MVLMKDDQAAIEPLGIELPYVYDGISIWVKADGTVINRWKEMHIQHPEESIITRRWELTDEWIDRQDQKNPNWAKEMVARG